MPESAGPTTVAHLDDDLHQGEGGGQVAALDQARDRRHPGGAGEAHQAGGEGADDVEHDERRVRHGGVDGHGAAGERHAHGRPDHDQAPVDRVADRPGGQRPGQEGDELGQADGADLQRGVGRGVDLVGDGHDGELGPQHGDELAGEEEPEVAALPQRGGVHQDPARHGSSLRSTLRGAARTAGDQESCRPRSRTEMSQAAGQSLVRRRASLPPSQKTTDPQKNAPSDPSRNSTSAAISSGRPGRPTGMGNMSRSGPVSGSARMAATIGVSIMPGGDGVEPEPRPGPLGPRRRPPDPVGHGQLGGRVGDHGTPGVGDAPAQLLVVVQAGVDQVGGDARLHRGGVRADGHGGTAGRQQRAQTLEHVDGAEVVHRREQRPGAARFAGQSGTRHDAGQHPAAALAGLRHGVVASRRPSRGPPPRRPPSTVDADDVPPRRAAAGSRWRHRYPRRHR